MIIENDTELRTFIPNVLQTVEGESTLYGKMLPFLSNAEAWVKVHFTGEEVFDAIENSPQTDNVRRMLSVIIVNHAFMKAVPSLDLILTPNGFGIVNNSNVAPASKERVASLIASLEAIRDSQINFLLGKLPQVDGWLDTPQAFYFGATLFPRLDLCSGMGIEEKRWERYQELREKLKLIETSLANRFFSPQLMEVFRDIAMNGNATYPELYVLQRIQALEIMLLKGEKPKLQQFFDIVDFIRKNDTLYQVWKDSDTAKLYEVKPFENKKESGGYWL